MPRLSAVCALGLALALGGCASPSEQPFSSSEDGATPSASGGAVVQAFRAALVEGCIPAVEQGRPLAEIVQGSEVISPVEGASGVFTTAAGEGAVRLSMSGGTCQVTAAGVPVAQAIRAAGEVLIDPFAFVLEPGGAVSGAGLRETYSKKASGRTVRVVLSGPGGQASGPATASVSARPG